MTNSICVHERARVQLTGEGQGAGDVDALRLEVHGHQLQRRHTARRDRRQEGGKVREGGVAQPPQPQPHHVPQVPRLGGA